MRLGQVCYPLTSSHIKNTCTLLQVKLPEYQDAYHVKLPPFASRVNQLAGWHGLTLAESCSHSLALNIF